MRKLLCLVLTVLSTTFIFAQAKKFDKKFGYLEYQLTPTLQIVDSQNNHIVVGQFKGFHQVGNTTIQTRGDFDIFIIKYDQNNQIQWVKTFGSSAEDNVVSLSCDKVGNIYFTGAYAGNAFYTSTNDSLANITGYSQSRYVTKLNTSGNAVWSKRFSATSASGDPTKSEVINDHEGRLYLIVTNRANGTLNSWKFQDSVIANPTFNHINVPRWLLTRLDENTGNIKWLDYIANPNISGSSIRILNISRPIIDRNNHLVFSVSHYGDHTTPIYVFGQYAATNSSINNILVRIDSVGTVRNFRDLGTATNALSDITDIAINKNNEVVLINKKAKATDNGITYDYTASANTFNYARIYDENFALVKIIKLGQQIIKSYVFDKQNRLVTFGTSNPANFNQSPIDEVLLVDSTSKTVTFNTAGTILTYLFRYNDSFKLDTFYLENRVNPLMELGAGTNSLRLANNGDIVPSVGYPVMNMNMFRYDSTLRSKNSLIGRHRDRQDMILGIVEDEEGQVYTSGVIHGLANFNSIRNATDSLKIPFEQGQDNFIAKYDKEGNIVWIKKIGTPANDIISQMTLSKTGIYFVVGNGSYSSWNYNDSVTVNGRQVLIKVDFNGNLLWSKEVYTTVNPTNTPTNPSFNLVKTLNSDNVLVGVYAYSSLYLGTTAIGSLGNKTGQVYAVLNGTNGEIIRYNRFALRGESFSQMGNPLSNAHEDKKGNLYFAFISNIIIANPGTTANEIYSLKANSLGFIHNWVTQLGMIKLDSTLEMSKFIQFTSYMHLGDINGQGDNIYITGRSRNNYMAYNSTNITTHAFAQNAHFVPFFARIDTALNITKITKFDTSSVETQFNIRNRKILIDPLTKHAYETVEFTGKTGLENISYNTTGFGGTDLMFVKHDSTGSIVGAQHLGTPQADTYSAGLINQESGLIFTSMTIDPNYKSVILSPNLTASSSFTEKPIEVILPNTKKSFSTTPQSTKKTSNTLVEINKEILSPESYLSKYISLNELGNRPDTAILAVTKTTFCQGDTAIIELNDATSIRWKRDQQFLSNEGAKIKITSSGVYKAIIKNIEGIEDSTRAITIAVTPTPISPLIENVAYCIGANTNTLTATASSNHTLLWHGSASTGGTATQTAVTPTSSVAGQTDYYVSQKSIVNACEGPRAKITITINSKPIAPVVENVAYCIGANTNTLTATVSSNHTLLWYGTASAGGTATQSGSTPSSTAIGQTDYYVSQRSNANTCEGPRAKITVTINAKPEKPVIENLSFCEGTVASNLTAKITTGNTLNWYGDETSSSKLSSTPLINTSNVGVKEYFATQTSATTGCESEKAKIVVAINGIPSKPIISRVEGNKLNSNTIGSFWYLDSAVLSDTNMIIKPTISGRYFVKSNQNGCVGALSEAYYFLATNIYSLAGDEFLNISPNPFKEYIKIDFLLKGIKNINLEFIQLSTGAPLFSKTNINPGVALSLPNMPSGIYLIKVTSDKNKIIGHIKVVKL